MKRQMLVTAAATAAVLVAVFSAGPVNSISAYADRGNSAAAHACQQGGYLSLVGADGTTFKNSGECTSYIANGGTFATGFVIPAGQTATLSDAHWTRPPCDALSYGYQLDLGANVTLGSKPAGCAIGDLPGATVGPFATVELLRVFLNDTGLSDNCNYTFYSDGNHALVDGSNPWTVSILDSYFCELGTSPDVPAFPGDGNVEVTVTIS